MATVEQTEYLNAALTVERLEAERAEVISAGARRLAELVEAGVIGRETVEINVCAIELDWENRNGYRAAIVARTQAALRLAAWVMDLGQDIGHAAGDLVLSVRAGLREHVNLLALADQAAELEVA